MVVVVMMVMVVEVRRLLLMVRLLLMLHTGLRDLRLPIGSQRGSEAPRCGVHHSEPAVAVLHRAQDVCD